MTVRTFSFANYVKTSSVVTAETTLNVPHATTRFAGPAALVVNDARGAFAQIVGKDLLADRAEGNTGMLLCRTCFKTQQSRRT